MTVKVLFFARLRELAGRERETLTLPDDALVGDALLEVERRFPAVADVLKNCRVAVDEEFTTPEAVLGSAAVLAIIPPVSGG